MFARDVAHPTSCLDLISGVSLPRVRWKRRDLPGFRVPPCACAVFYDPGGISASRNHEAPTSSAPITSVADSRNLFLSRLDRTASRSLCTLRSRRRRRTTQHSVPAGSLLLAGQVHLLL